MTSIEAEIKLADDDRQFALKYIENHWKDESDDKKFGFEMGILIGFNKAKETLYTEEQVREAYWIGVNRGNGVNVMSIDNFIQSLKQPKQ